MKGRLSFVGCLVLIRVSAGLAYELSHVCVESWSGTGPNQVLLVVDFWPQNGAADSFAFGCRFSASQMTGLQLLDAIEAGDPDFSYAQSGGFVTDIWYVKGATEYHAGYNWPASYWSYWLSDDFGQSWEYSPYGPGSRILHDGDTDGWLAKPGNDWDSVPVTPLLGDMNCDGMLDGFDVQPFVLALTDPAAYELLWPDCHADRGDIDGSGSVDGFDIQPFVALLVGL